MQQGFSHNTQAKQSQSPLSVEKERAPGGGEGEET